jgi:transposase InsO family protein
MLAGFVYVAFVVDVFSRRVLGWRVSSCRQTRLVLDAFGQALAVPHRHNARWTADGLVHHSDAAWQHTSVAITFFQTSIEFRPTLLAQREDACVKGQTRRAEIFHQLITGLETTEAS